MDPRTEERLRQLGALQPNDAASLWAMLISSTGAERQELEQLLDLVLFQALAKSFGRQSMLEPPPASTCVGPYHVGDVLFPDSARYCTLGLREDEWCHHLLITGMTGKGKTNLVFHLLLGLAAKQKPFLVFDWKRGYRDLLQLRAFKNMRVFSVGGPDSRLRFNPLIPPQGIGAGEWLMKVIDVLKHAYFVGEGVEYVLRRALDHEYEKCGFYAGSEPGSPSLVAVRFFVLKMPLPGRMALWKASAMRVLEALTFRHGLGPVFGCAEGFNPGLLNTNLVLELDSLSDSDKVFLTEILILWIYEFRKRQRVREQFLHALVIEEAHHVLSERKERTAGVETIMEGCLRQIREFGEAVIAIDQEPSKLSNSVKANTSTKITFALGNGKDITDVSRSMSLEPDEEAALNRLPTGHAVLSQRGRISTPVLLRIPWVRIRKGAVSDREIRDPIL